MKCQTCFEIIKDMAIVNLAVHCEVSGEDFEFSETPTDPVDEWASRIAQHALDLGWRCDEKGRVVSPVESAKK